MIYQMSDGHKTNTASAVQHWPCGNTGQTLYKTRKLTFYRTLDETDARYLDRKDAAYWLKSRGMELPEELEVYK
jgi:hypothetical protein